MRELEFKAGATIIAEFEYCWADLCLTVIFRSWEWADLDYTVGEEDLNKNVYFLERGVACVLELCGFIIKRDVIFS